MCINRLKFIDSWWDIVVFNLNSGNYVDGGLDFFYDYNIWVGSIVVVIYWCIFIIYGNY